MALRKESMGKPGAKLAALFSQDDAWKKSGNESMKYNPAPLSQSLSAAPEAPSTEFLFTAAINLIQYDAAGTGTNLGARGMALLYQVASKSYHLVCYETASQKQDCSVVVNGNFKLSLLPGGHYCAFFDEKQQYWCTQLANEEQVSSLAQAVACVNHAQLRQNTAEGASMPLIMQDLSPDPAPEAKPLASGDSVKVKYTLHLLSATHPKNPLGTMVGSVSQPKPVKLGAGKELRGLEQGLVGMKKGQSRLLLIPPELGYGSAPAGAIPANSTLLVFVTVTASKYAGEKKSKIEEEPAETSGPPVTSTPAPAAQATAQAPPANTSDDDNNALLKRIAQQSGGFSMAHLAGLKPTSSPNPTQPTPQVMPTPQPLGPPASALFNPMSQYASQEQLLQMQQFQQQQQQLLQQLGMFGVSPAGLSGIGAGLAPGLAGGLSGLAPPPPGVPGGIPGFPPTGLHSAAVAPGPSVADQKQIGLLESMAKRIDSIHAALSGSPELTEGLEGALSGYEVVRALQNSLKDRERTRAAMEANKKKMAQMQDKIDELRSASDTSRTESASSWDKRLEAFQEDARQRQALIADLTREKKELQAALMVKSQELSDVSFKLNLAQTDLERSIASGGNVQELQKQAVEARAELSSAKASLAALASEKASQLSELRAAHAAELASLSAQHQEALGALNAKLSGAQAEQKKAEDASLALTTKANLLQGQVDELSAQLKQQQVLLQQTEELTAQLKQQQQANELLRTKEEEERNARIAAQEALAVAQATLNTVPPPVSEEELKARLKEEFEAGRAAGLQGEAQALRDQESTQALLNGLKETVANLEQKLLEAVAERDDVVVKSKAAIKKLKEQLLQAREAGDPDTVLGELLQLLTQLFEAGETYEGAQLLTLIKKAMKRVINQLRSMEGRGSTSSASNIQERRGSEPQQPHLASRETSTSSQPRLSTSDSSSSNLPQTSTSIEPAALPSESRSLPLSDESPQLETKQAEQSSYPQHGTQAVNTESEIEGARSFEGNEAQISSSPSSSSPPLESEQPGLEPVNIVLPPSSDQPENEGW